LADPAGRDPIEVGVVLAAGAGRRFGGPKALIRFEGKLLVERAVDTLVAGGCSDVVVVLGAQAAEVRRQASLDRARVVVNEQWDDGMSTSLRCGLSACTGAQAAIITLVDQPGVTPDVVRRLRSAWSASDRPVVVATYEGEARHPVLFGADVWDAVMASVRGDSGARAWLRENPDLVEHVEVADIGDCADIDTPDDLRAR
jgi:CTP:molybdopterin cytidylyltransferase MocA